MGKFDKIRMKDLVKVEDPDANGGITLNFTDNIIIKVHISAEGKLVCETS